MPLVHMLCKGEETLIISDPQGEIYNKTSDLLFDNGML